MTIKYSNKLLINIKANCQMDSKLYSRQIYAIGEDTMKKIITSTCIISGMTGLGIEVAKNIALSGVRKIILHDKFDMNNSVNKSNNYFCRNEEISNKNFYKKIMNEIKKLNTNVKIGFVRILNYNIIKKSNVLIMCDQNMFECISYNEFCRNNDIKFIMIKSNGLVGMIFSDYGNKYIYKDDNGEPYKNGIISEINENIVTTFDPHGMYTGDKVVLNMGSKKVYEIKVISRNKFEVNSNEIKDDSTVQYKMFTEHKNRKTTKFKSLLDNILSPVFENGENNNFIHFITVGIDLWKLINYTNVCPERANVNTLDEIFKCIQLMAKIKYDDNDIERVKKIVYTNRGNLCPINSIIGGMCGQEIINVIGEKFRPIKQLRYIDFSYILPTDYLAINSSEFIRQNDNYDEQRIIFGNKYINLLKNIRPFIIGAGAIGCEYAKITACMGMKQQYIIDDDSIEKSNLSRQFLFGIDDIGKSKAQTVSEKIFQIDNNITITPFTNKFSTKSNAVGKTLMDNVDILLGGVDNIETRLDIDYASMLFQKPYIDAGTMGTKGNIQTIIPMATEQYSALRDHVDESVPLCTIKMFPYKYEHIVSYALDVFAEYFGKEDALNVIYETDNLMEYANEIFNKLFIIDIQNIIDKYPLNHIQDGESFWSGARRFPKIVIYNESNSEHLDFVNSFVNEFQCIKSSKNKIKYIEFNKENDNHVNIISSIAYIRANIYNIPVQSKLNTKKIAGNIIPALNTTTSIVAGYAGIEIYKIIYWMNKEEWNTQQCFKTGSFNTAIQMYSFSDAMECKKYMMNDIAWSPWNLMELNENETPNNIFSKYTNGVKVQYSNQDTKVLYPDYIMCYAKNLVINNDPSDENYNKSIASLIHNEYPFVMINFESDDMYQLTCKIVK